MKLRETTYRTLAQVAALVCVLALALWTTVVLWFHLTRPAGAGQLELIFLGVLAPLLWVATVLYAFRIGWSYPPGILIHLRILAGGVKAAPSSSLRVHKKSRNPLDKPRGSGYTYIY